MATRSTLFLLLEVSKELVSSVTHFLSPFFYTICHFPNFAHFYPEDGGSIFLWDVGTHLSYCMMSWPWRLEYECVWNCSTFVCYLTTLSGLRLYSTDDRMLNEYEAVGEMRIGKRNRSTQRKPAPKPLCQKAGDYLSYGMVLKLF
jgi:hypothetical protein